MIVNNAFGNIYEINSAGTTLWTKSGANSSHAYRFTKCEVRGPIVSASSSESQVCPGDPVTLSSSAYSVTETSPTYSYTWSSGETTQNPVVNPSENTVYTVTITNTAIDCSATASVSINVYPEPAVPVVTQIGEELNSTAAVSYQWYLDGSEIAGATNQNYSPVEDGIYTVLTTDANGCTALSDDFSYIGSGISDDLNGELKAYPNPTTGMVYVEGTENLNDAKIMVFDLFGKQIMTENVAEYIDLSVFENGVYYLIIENKGERVLYQKVVLMK